jgi:UPF0755 protein
MKKRRLFVIFLVVFTVLLSSFSLYVYQVFNTPNILIDKDRSYLYIVENQTFKQLQNELYETGYVKDLVSFSLLARLMKYDRNMKPGRYLLEPEMSNYQAIKLLRSGIQTPTTITFHNVRTPFDLAGKITRNIFLDSSSVAQYLTDPRVAARYGFDSTNFFTMFLPDTYEVYWTITRDELFEKFKYEFDRFWTEERKAKADSIGFSPMEVVTLASIVDAETMYDDESERVAGVYLNRLERGIRLQADPTLIFALQDFNIKRVLNEHKEIDSPYNTYKYRGLPPGPINLPSKRTIDAVLNYEDHNFFYFCARPDFSGYHNFASTLAEHNRNARAYQRALNRARIYN